MRWLVINIFHSVHKYKYIWWKCGGSVKYICEIYMVEVWWKCEIHMWNIYTLTYFTVYIYIYIYTGGSVKYIYIHIYIFHTSTSNLKSCWQRRSDFFQFCWYSRIDEFVVQKSCFLTRPAVRCSVCHLIFLTDMTVNNSQIQKVNMCIQKVHMSIQKANMCESYSEMRHPLQHTASRHIHIAYLITCDGMCEVWMNMNI